MFYKLIKLYPGINPWVPNILQNLCLSCLECRLLEIQNTALEFGSLSQLFTIFPPFFFENLCEAAVDRSKYKRPFNMQTNDLERSSCCHFFMVSNGTRTIAFSIVPLVMCAINFVIKFGCKCFDAPFV